METGASFPKPAPFYLPFIGEIYSLALLGAHRDRLLHRSVLLVPALNHVGPRRKSLYCKRSVVARHCKEGVTDHADIRADTGMHIALDRDHDFLAGERFVQGRLPRRLRLVPVGVHLGLWMDVVVGGVAVLDLEALPRHQPDHVRFVDRKSTRLNSSHLVISYAVFC